MSATTHTLDHGLTDHGLSDHGRSDAAHEQHTPVEIKTELLRAGSSPVTGFTLNEILYAVALIGGVLIAIVGTAFAMAVGVCLFHLLFHWIAELLAMAGINVSPRVADAWGNAVGTVVVIPLSFVMILATLLTMGERKWSAMMQDRMGPNQARLPIPGLRDNSLFGLPHILADVLKMLTKEEIVPAQGNKLLFHLAPAIAFCPAFVLFAVIPMAPRFHLWRFDVNMQVASIDQGLLYIFAVASLAVLGTSLAGWSSNNKYALLGGVRASAQMVSYEVTLGLTLVGLMIVYHSLRLDTIAEAEGHYLWGLVPTWGIVYQPLAIVAYFAAAHAEIKRGPFDMPEGESEIVGYFIEYSGLKFGIFMIAEFVEVVVFAGLFTVLFFGSYHIPWVNEHWLDLALADFGGNWLSHLPAIDIWWLHITTAGWRMFGHGLGTAVVATIYLSTFIAKTVFFCWLSLAARWTFPRFRYDQVMNLGWKLLLPVSLVNVVLTGVVTLAWGVEGAAAVGLIELLFVVLFVVGAFKIDRTGDETLLPSAPAPAAHAHH